MAQTGEKTDACKLLVGKPEGDHWEGMDVAVKILLKCVLKNSNVRV
jgi:hypothetical protein